MSDDYGFSEQTGGFTYFDVDTQFSPKWYTDLVIPQGDRSYYFSLAARKDATKPFGSDQYVYNVYEQLFKPVDEEIDYEIGEIDRKYSYLTPYITSAEFNPSQPFTAPISFIKDNAPNLGINAEAKEGTVPTYEGYVADAILKGQYTVGTEGGRPRVKSLKTAADVNEFIEFLYNQSAIRLGSPLDEKNKTERRAFALNLLQEKRDAEKKWGDELRGWDSDTQSVFDKRGLPSRNLRYDPRTVKGYDQWEKGQILEFRKSVGRDPSEQELNQLRRMVADKYHKQGYSPYYDTILRARAGS